MQKSPVIVVGGFDDEHFLSMTPANSHFKKKKKKIIILYFL